VITALRLSAEMPHMLRQAAASRAPASATSRGQEFWKPPAGKVNRPLLSSLPTRHLGDWSLFSSGATGGDRLQLRRHRTPPPIRRPPRRVAPTARAVSLSPRRFLIPTLTPTTGTFAARPNLRRPLGLSRPP